MKICVVHPKITSESANRLEKAIGVPAFSSGGFIPFDYDVYFNYGSSRLPWDIKDKTINHPDAVAISTDKIQCYSKFSINNIPTCEFVTREERIPKKWDWIVCREVIDGRNCEGVTITQQENIVKGCPLYTRYFHHHEEHRIVVFKGEVVARYMKTNLKGGEYELQYMLPQGYEELDKSSIQAAKAIGLDYAGVDVLYNNKTGKHIVLEINSGPLLTDEMEEFFVNYFKGK